ncbi:pimeloyl-ACP methyl ester carboxylesterase [Curtobacterium flaccumfaciens]|uniref:Pimeloyl-ACP methyl ester carboxylesterase n=1 Tax=Curtobacterium salicis TaxID=1779862 RepID=A0ABX0T7Y6_9MICO|nr:alpha/beta fold hydrolase [Curtobacterium sp. WW7]NII41606.1 pimeloyl-ACP methyl ester carboxylesterase [Curtobacterium sp. WW7]
MPNTLPDDLPVLRAGDPAAPTALVLHGGGGPRTVAPVVGHLAASRSVHAPTHPGWDGTERPGSIASVADLASAYLARLLDHGERDVLVVGSSIGGWIALEMAVQAAADERFAGVLGSVVVIDTVGVVVDGEPIADFFALDARGLAEVAWHDAERGFQDPALVTEEQRAILRSNGQTMAVLAGRDMSDATLLGRLAAVDVPTLVVWGASDRVVTPTYGRAVAGAVPGAVFAEVPAAGHLPHLEAPEATWAVLDPFVTQH